MSKRKPPEKPARINAAEMRRKMDARAKAKGGLIKWGGHTK